MADDVEAISKAAVPLTASCELESAGPGFLEASAAVKRVTAVSCGKWTMKGGGELLNIHIAKCQKLVKHSVISHTKKGNWFFYGCIPENGVLPKPSQCSPQSFLH